MMNPMTVVYLHTPAPNDERLLKDMSYGLSDIFRTFCREHFTFEDPLDYPPLNIVPVASAHELDVCLFSVSSAEHFLSSAGQNCCLFLFDDEINGKSLNTLTLDGLSLMRWFTTYFPAIPKIVLTIPGHEHIRIPPRRWVQKERAIFENLPRYANRIEHMFKAFWMPRFWFTLRQYVRTKAGTNWHTPGHNGGNAFEHSVFLHGFHDAFNSMIFRSDLSVSVEGLGDLSEPEDHTPLSESQRLTSEIFGSAQSCYVTNGTSTSNKAMLMTLLRPGEVVLLDRNCHKSVHHAVVMAGAVPRYLPANFNAKLGVWGPIDLADLKAELTKSVQPNQHPKLLILTTCTYEGVLYPVWEIGRLCEEAGVLFYADEAWAPYLNFHPYYTRFEVEKGVQMRYNAVNELAGAHFAVQSTHKALAAFSQASMIHVSTRFKFLLESDTNKQFRWLRKRFVLHGRGSYEKFSHDLHEVLRYWHSTSPHYPMLATLDFAGVQMRLEGLRILEERLHWVSTFKSRVAAECGLPVSECFVDLNAITGDGNRWYSQGYMHDPLKMIISFKSPRDCMLFKKRLQKAQIQWEKSTPVTILFLVTAGTVEEHFDYLFQVCRQMSHTIGVPQQNAMDLSIEKAIAGQAVVLPRDAALCDGELVELQETEGRICSQLLVPYPPGIPVFIPGLRITRAMIDLIQDVIDTDGARAVHGLFTRGKKVLVEVLNKDEEDRVLRLP